MDRIELALRDLRKSITRMKELSAWLELRKVESRGRRDSFACMYDPTEGDLKAEVGFFLKLSSDLRVQFTGQLEAADQRQMQALSRLEEEFIKIDCPRLCWRL